MKQFVLHIRAILSPQERNKFSGLILLDILLSVLDIAFLAFLLFVIHFYTQSDDGQQFSFLPGWFFNKNSLLLISLFFLLYSLKNLTGFLIHRAQSRFICNVATRLSEVQLRKYLNGKYEDYIVVDSAVHIRKISHQPIDFSQHILGGIQQITTQSVLILFTIGVMLIFNARIFLLLFLILLPPVVGIFYLVRTRIRSVRKHSQVSIEKSWQHLREALTGFVESNIYNKNDFFLKRYISRQAEFNRYVSDLLTVQGIPGRMIEVFALLGLFILIAINKWTGDPGSSNLVTVGAFIAAAYKIIPGIVKILNNSGQINNYMYTIQDLVPGDNISEKEIEISHAGSIHSVCLKNISFSYNGSSLLNNLNLAIKPGDFIGISGCSGSGKTTLLNLMLGFLLPKKGEIEFNEKRADDEKIKEYWQNISYVKQQPFLLHDSIAHNIILDNPCDEQRLEDVIRITGLRELIDSFPESNDKIIMESGKNISGGQRQRIAIARALYKKADLIILDEPFNELDEETELSFLSHFRNLSQQGKMIVLITHNKASFSYCNKIISLDEQRS